MLGENHLNNIRAGLLYGMVLSILVVFFVTPQVVAGGGDMADQKDSGMAVKMEEGSPSTPAGSAELPPPPDIPAVKGVPMNENGVQNFPCKSHPMFPPPNQRCAPGYEDTMGCNNNPSAMCDTQQFGPGTACICDPTP